MQLGLFSISYAGLWGQQSLSLNEFMATASRLGYDGVMLAGKRPHLSPLDFDDKAVTRLRDLLATHKIRCLVMAAYVDLAGGQAAEVPYQELQIAYVTSLARMAAMLDAKVVRIFTAYECVAQPIVAQWRRVVETIREMCDRAAAYDVTLAVQNHHDLAVHTDVLLELLADVDRPNCRLGYDAWSPALRGEDLYAGARRAAPMVAITTNADYVRLPRFQYQPDLVNYRRVEPDLVRAVPFGDGCIDFTSFFRGLVDGGFNGIATFEMCSPIRGGGSLENLNAYAARYVAWMRDHAFADNAP